LLVTEKYIVHGSKHLWKWFNDDSIIMGVLSLDTAHCLRSWGSSINIVSDYRLNDQGLISSRGKKDLSSSLCVQTNSEAHLASYAMGTWVTFPGVKHDRGITLTTHPHIVPVSLLLCPPQIPHGLTLVQTQVSLDIGWQITTWAICT
jgi:hypothetical protein